MVTAAVMLEERYGALLPRWVLLIGDASYSLYLGHLLVFSVLAKLLRRAHLMGGATARVQDEVLTVVVCFWVAVAASLPLYLLLEKPLNNRLRKWLAHEPPPAEQVVEST
jgi:peptidoglycan/LPS O-acetylase OafA/YrhL